MKKIIQKFIFLFLVFSLFSFPDLLYNKNGSAQEIKPLGEYFDCEEREQIKFPYPYNDDIVQKKILTENIYEVSIGKSADMIEHTADVVVDKLYRIDEALEKEIDGTKEMLDFIEECGQDQYECTPHCEAEATGYTDGECFPVCPDNREVCDDDYCNSECALGEECCCTRVYGCKPRPCSGDACPDDEIGNRFYDILVQAMSIDRNYKELADFFTFRFLPITLCQEQWGVKTRGELQECVEINGEMIPPKCSTIYNIDDFSKCICGVFCEEEEGFPNAEDMCFKLCYSPVEFYTISDFPAKEGYLEKARKILTKCTLSPFEWEAYLRGETPYIQFFGCREVLSYHIPIHTHLKGKLLDYCYGINYCEIYKEGNLPPDLPSPPFPYPCANDYFCCRSKKF